MDKFIEHIKVLYHSKHKNGLPLVLIFEKVLNLNNKNGIINQYKNEKEKIEFSYIFIDDKFIINYKGIEYKIEKKPFEFYNEQNKILGKVFDIESFKKLMNRTINNLEIYNEKNIKLKSKEDILNNVSRKYFLKEKNKFTQEKFNLLNSKREFEPEKIDPITISKFELSPIPLKEFHSNEVDMELILENRNDFITYINYFMEEDWDKKILIIYGCDGIGKSSTYIYLSNLYNNYKVLYFNLKAIMENKEESYDLFTFEIMRYFTVNKEDDNNEDTKNENFALYLEAINNINKNNFNFWEEVLKFLNNNEYNDTLLIIDQYKDIYDRNSNLENLKNILLNKITSYKLLICISVNNKNAKDKLINEFNYGSIESPEIIYYDNKINDNKDFYEKEIEETDLEKEKNYSSDEDDEKFDNVFIFKNIENKKQFKNEIKEKSADSLKTQKNKGIINIIKDTSNYEKNRIEIIYISELISVKNIKDDKVKYLNLFNYNPKYYIKFEQFLIDKYDSMDDLYKQFLKKIESDISIKIRKYYDDIKYDSLKNESIIELIKMKDLVDNKIRFTAPILIKYIKEFPMKYIKIKVYNKNENDNNNISNNLFKLNTKFENTEFYFEFCFPFFGIIISKLIYMNQNYYSISYDNLSGSGKGYFIEQKIKRAFIFNHHYGVIILRCVWNFNTNVKDEPKQIFEYDFENYKKIYYDDKKIVNNDKTDNSDDENDKDERIDNDEIKIIIDEKIGNNHDEKIKSEKSYNDIEKIVDNEKINNSDNSIINNKIINLKNKKIEIDNCVYYIVPGSQTNKNIDSALLIPDIINDKEKKYKVIFFQIKQGNVEIKNKREYISSSFIAKKKFENLYDIEISNVFFYFILGKEFKNDKAINDLTDKTISFLFFSYVDGYLYNNELRVKALNDLINSFAEIKPINDKNEEKDLLRKNYLINELEECLKTKSLFLGKKVTRNFFENGRKIFFKDDKGLKLKNKQRDNIINFIKCRFNVKNNFTLKYVFYIRRDEFSKLSFYENLFGIYYYNNNFYIINHSFIYQLKNEITLLSIKKNSKENISILDDVMDSFNNNNKEKNLRFTLPEKSIKLENINNNKYIFVFKLYYL